MQPALLRNLDPAFPEPELVVIFPKPYKRGKKKTGRRQEESKDAPVTAVPHTLSEEELLTAFPDDRYKKTPDEVYKHLEFHPASFDVLEHHVEVYDSADGGNFARAERPADLFRNRLAPASLVASIYNLKYVNALPIKPLSKNFEHNDVFLPTQTPCLLSDPRSGTVPEPCIRPDEAQTFGLSCDACGSQQGKSKCDSIQHC